MGKLIYSSRFSRHARIDEELPSLLELRAEYRNQREFYWFFTGAVHGMQFCQRASSEEAYDRLLLLGQHAIKSQFSIRAVQRYMLEYIEGYRMSVDYIYNTNEEIPF